jgi:quinol monooxygenase YgiN
MGVSHVVYEILVQTVDPARRDEYVQVFKRALREWNPTGFHGGKACPSVEDPTRVVMILEWDSVEAHTSHRGTPAHTRFRETFSPYQTAPTQLHHYTIEDL